MSEAPPTVQVKHDDPYSHAAHAVQDPPKRLRDMFKHLGPGLILVGSIVGSGELIMTTRLGAQAGLTLLWLVFVACFIKVIVQAELGRITISTGKTCLEAFNLLPGPRLKAGWFVWLWFASVLFSFVGSGGIIGGVGQSLALAFPQISAVNWTWITAFVTIGLLFSGRYQVVERFSVPLVGGFTFITLACAIGIQWTPYAVHWNALVDGMMFRIPTEAVVLATAMAVYAGTGVGAGEMIAYTYWCVEKGYARCTGKPDLSPEWAERARGWIRVMHLDVALTMIVFTIATVAFYLLGGAVLHAKGLVPEGTQVIDQLKGIYTEVLGPIGKPLFFFGAFCVLYSTVFSGVAGGARTIADALCVVGVVPRGNFQRRLLFIRIVTVVNPLLWAFFYSRIQNPPLMLVINSIVGMLLFPSITFGVLWYRYRGIDKRIAPTWRGDLIMWSCGLGIFLISTFFLSRYGADLWSKFLAPLFR